MKSLIISSFVLVVLGLVVITGLFPTQQAEGTFEPMPCPSCVTITEQNLELHKQNSPIIVWTDSTVYDRGSKIQINGYSKNFDPGIPVTLTVFNPLGNVILVKQVNFDNEGTFSTNMIPSGNDWKLNGKYIIKAQQGSPGRVFRTQVDLIGDYKGKHVECGPRQLSLESERGNGVHCMPYSLTGATVKKAMLNVKDKSLILKIDSEDEGVLTLNIPRFILDSRATADREFGVFVDGKQVAPHSEVHRNHERILTVGVKEGASEVKIDGNIALAKQKDIVCLPSEIKFVSDTAGSHCISYSIRGATVQKGVLDTKQKALIVNIDAHDQGLLTLHIPRKVLDAKQGEQDDAKDANFMVLVDGKPRSVHNEQKDEEKRIITFGFTHGSETIEVIGTRVIPEFSDILAYLILAASLALGITLFWYYNSRKYLVQKSQNNLTTC